MNVNYSGHLQPPPLTTVGEAYGLFRKGYDKKDKLPACSYASSFYNTEANCLETLVTKERQPVIIKRLELSDSSRHKLVSIGVSRPCQPPQNPPNIDLGNYGHPPTTEKSMFISTIESPWI